MKKNIYRKIGSLLAVAVVAFTSLTSCYEEPEKTQPYGADELTIYQIISERAELSAFKSMLDKCGYNKMVSTYQVYTCFAPENAGVSLYLDSLYRDDNKACPHNGIKEDSNFFSLDVMDKVKLMSDSLCVDIIKYHLSPISFQQIDIEGTGSSCSTLIVGRSIAIDVFTGNHPLAGKSSLNGEVAIIDGDIKASNGFLHICNGVIPRTDRTINNQLNAESDLSIFYEALRNTGLDKVVEAENKNKEYLYYTTGKNQRDGNILYCPSECLIKWTIFAETNEVFNKEGIYNFHDLKEKCKEWYAGSSAWYDYLKEMGITPTTDDTYTDEFNVVHMFVAYHILQAGMPIDKIVYEKNSRNSKWNVCFGYEPQDYFPTMLRNTMLKVWQTNPKTTKELWINRYRLFNTMTDQIGTFGDPDTHPIIFPGVKIDRKGSVESRNGYIHRIGGILKYDQNAVNSQKERMRLDSSNFLYELINNGIRFATNSEISALDQQQNGTTDGGVRVAFDNTYFDNIYCYNPETKLHFCVMGDWRANNADQFQGFGAYDFAVKLPNVPTGTYEIRIVYPPMARGGLMQYYIGKTNKQEDMLAQGIPFDACADPTLEGNVMGCEQIYEYSEDHPDTDYGVESDQRMKVRGYMRAPASFSRAGNNSITDQLKFDKSLDDPYQCAKQIVGSSSCRSEWGYGTMMLRRIICTWNFKQSEDCWLRIKSLIEGETLGWSFDFIEIVPISVVNSTTMTEDWY